MPTAPMILGSGLASRAQQVEELRTNAAVDLGSSLIDIRQRLVLYESILDSLHRGVSRP